MPAAEAPEAPNAAPESAAPGSDLGGFHDATGAHEVWTFPAKPETAPETAAPSEPAADQKPETPKPDAAKPEATPDDDDLPDDLVEKVLRHPKGQGRIDQLVNNKFGNRLQQERETWAKEQRQQDEAWDKASEFYTKLTEDDDFFEEAVKNNGSPAIRRFMADYEERSALRNQSDKPAPVDLEAVKSEFTHDFNKAAVAEFQATVKATLPFFGELPEDVRAQIDGAAYDPERNWLEESLTALGTGIQKHIEKLKRDHSQALREAVEAGRNDANAERQTGAPVVVTDPDPGFDPRDIERRYALGDTSVTRADFRRALAMLGKSI